MKKRFSTFYIANKPLWTTKTSVSKTHKLVFLQRGYSMVLVKNLKFCEGVVLCKIQPEKEFGHVLVGTQALLDNINMYFKKKAKLAFLSMILFKKLNFFYLLFLWKLDREKVFPDVLEKKKAFKDYKKNFVRKTQILIFFPRG